MLLLLNKKNLKETKNRGLTRF